MTKPSILLTLCFLGGSVSAQDPSFHCNAAKRMVNRLTLGPDGIATELRQQPLQFTRQMIPGWICLTTPFPPEQDGRNYVQDISCSLPTGGKDPSDTDFAAAGELLRNGLNSFFNCFRDDLIRSMPKSYSNTTRGEGIVGLLKQTFNGHPLLVEYGYFRNASPPTAIIWELTVGYSTASSPL
jgi:hypothetical protein